MGADAARGADSSPASRRRRVRRWVIGLVAAALVVGIHASGVLRPLELLSEDWRARTFGPDERDTSPVVVVGIDDRSLETVGRWPWPREQLAAVIRELSAAGAGVIALDLLLDDAQEPRWLPDGGSGFSRVSGDEALAEAIREHGRVVAAAGFPLRFQGGGGAGEANHPGASLTLRVYEAMRGDAALRGWDRDRAVDAMAERFSLDEAQLAGAARADLIRAWERAAALARAARGSSVPAEGARAEAPRAATAVPPIPVIAEAAARLGSVTFDTYDADGVVRRVPAVTAFGARLWPTLGLAAAALHLDLPASAIEVSAGRIDLGPTGLGLPMSSADVRGDRREGLASVQWPAASNDWQRQVRVRGKEGSLLPGVISVGFVYELGIAEERIGANIEQLERVVDAADSVGLGAYTPSPEAFERLRTAAIGGDAWNAAVGGVRDDMLKVTAEARDLLTFVGEPGPDASERDRSTYEYMREIADAPGKLIDQIERGADELLARREQLRGLIDGRVVFIGWTATGAVADFVKTAIHPRTPGVMVHAVVAWSVLADFHRSRVPSWIDGAIVVGAGGLGAAIGVTAMPMAGPALLFGLALAWWLVAGLVFREANLIVAIAGPWAALGGAWLAVMLQRLLIEQRRRRRTEDRFKAYVSPEVVDILVGNPDLASMEPRRRELTVMFTDLEGFTTTAERLGTQRTAETLARHLASMTEELQHTGATLDKFLGDGLMAFWGAPIADETHAAHACEAALAMVERLERMNAEGAFGDAGALRVRIGIATGEMMVGDFGNPPARSSYTVIGDTANLASRLEGANKAFGSTVIVSGATRDQTLRTAGAGLFAFRLLGRVVVRGRTEPEPVYELLPPIPPLPPSPLLPHPPAAAGGSEEGNGERVRVTEALVERYAARDFGACAPLIDRLRDEFGDGKLAAIYEASIKDWNQPGRAGEAFDGTIVLTEK